MQKKSMDIAKCKQRKPRYSKKKKKMAERVLIRV
jgi:hypothetical protein